MLSAECDDRQMSFPLFGAWPADRSGTVTTSDVSLVFEGDGQVQATPPRPRSFFGTRARYDTGTDAAAVGRRVRRGR